MNPAMSFRLAVRAIGVLLIGLGAPSVWNFGVYLVELIPTVGNPESASALRVLYYIPTYLCQAGMGVYLLFFGDKLIRACVRDALTVCGACGADLAKQAKGETCAECGAARMVRVRIDGEGGAGSM